MVVVEDDLDGVSQVEERALLLEYFHGHDSVASDLRFAFGCSGASLTTGQLDIGVVSKKRPLSLPDQDLR